MSRDKRILSRLKEEVRRRIKIVKRKIIHKNTPPPDDKELYNKNSVYL